MASYQVPQFLDSGDKILGPLNVRQFGYALGGFLLSVILYTVTQRLYPLSGWFAILPAVPVALLATFLALGKYNGRDTDVYALKFILFFLKPRIMAYRRLPYVEDLDSKLNDWTESAILNRWQKRLLDEVKNQKNTVQEFKQASTKEKIQKIKNISDLVDTNTLNTLAEVKRQEEMLTQIQNPTLKPIKPGHIVSNAEVNFFDPPTV